jgi:hypothetical protein
MKMNRLSFFLASAFMVAFVATASAAPFLSTNDFIIGIDTDDPVLPSSSPDGEPASYAIDGNTGTKYLNFAKLNTGFIVTPFIGASTVQSIQLTTANDAVERDPLTWELYGTNTPGSWTPHGDGAGSWTLIASSDANLPDTRATAGPIQSFSNTTAYSNYRLLFPNVKNATTANSMQIAEVGLFESNDGSGFSVWQFDEAIPFAYAAPDSRSPAAESVTNVLSTTALTTTGTFIAAEGPANVVDGTNAKYFNGGGAFSGFIVTPAAGPKQVQSFRITTANDAETRDPTGWRLFGTNDTITSANTGNNNVSGTAENWTLIGEGGLSLPVGEGSRNTLGPIVSVPNGASYKSYKMQFTGLNNPQGSGGMQIAEAAFFESLDASGANILAPGDPVVATHAEMTKYLNFGGANSGFIVTPAAGAKALTSFQITTADDWPARDPSSYILYGTNDAITSTADSQGTAENWVEIASGALDLPLARNAADDVVTVANTTSYSSYRMVFPTLRHGEDPPVEDLAMQIAAIQFFDASTSSPGDFNSDGKVDGRDLLIWQRNPSVGSLADWKANYGQGGLSAVTAVPEPSAIVLIGGCVLGCFGVRRRASV